MQQATTVLKGKTVANSVLEQASNNLMNLSFTPKMALLHTSTDPASVFYVQNILKQASKLGVTIELINVPVSADTFYFVDIIKECNLNESIHGIMIQKPLPIHIDENSVNNTINPVKDIDGINPSNLGYLFSNQECYVPCTATAVIELIKHYNIETQGKHVVILGRSTVVAKPLIGLLLGKHQYGNATLSVCHSYTKDMDKLTKQADILISAIGKARYVGPEMINETAIVIDVGINLIKDSSKGDFYVGDIDYDACFDKVSAITPVPGGIGSITTAVLLRNLTKAALVESMREKN